MRRISILAAEVIATSTIKELRGGWGGGGGGGILQEEEKMLQKTPKNHSDLSIRKEKKLKQNKKRQTPNNEE